VLVTVMQGRLVRAVDPATGFARLLLPGEAPSAPATPPAASD